MIHSSSVISKKAKIGKNVKIGPFCYVGDYVELHDNIELISNVHVEGNTTIGKETKIFPFASIGTSPQDLKYNGEETTVEIGDFTTIRECVTINKGTTDRMKTVIGSNCLIMAYCHIAHDCLVGNNAIFSNNSTLAGHVTIGENVVLAGLVAVHQFVSIGQHAFVTGGSLVRKDVPPFVKAAREPLSYVGINSVGLRRRGFDTDKIREIQNIYRILYQRNYNNTQAVQILEAEMEATNERDEILQFIRDSQRGIMKGYFSNN
jgi:UDP-N-acetylglucosamine acyltransferase